MSRVLVVDDEPRIVSFVSRALAAEGFAVDRANNGVRALEMANAGSYELVVLDLLMPGLDGVTLLRSLLEARPDQRVMVLSALSDVDTKVRCLELGATDYLAKPFALAELLARVRARLRHPSTARPASPRMLTAGRLSLDFDRRTADVGRGPVSLSERELLLLHHLMHHKDRTCSRMELLFEVWGYTFDPKSNVVDVCVGRLRAKLDPDIIETVRNVGYRLVPQ